MSLKAAVDRINTWTITGVTTNYGLDDLKVSPGEAALPAVWLAPAGDARPGVQPFDINASNAEVVVFFDHVLLIKGAAMANPSASFYDGLALVDNYLAKVKTDWTLNSNLAEPLKIVSAPFRPYSIGQVTYWAVVFRHRWVLVV